jgi:hypothetical protein
MKQKISIAAILVLSAVFAFGQRSFHKFNEDYRRNVIKNHSEVIKQENNKNCHNPFQRKNRNLPQSSFLKSTQSTKQKMDSLQYFGENTGQYVNYKEAYTYDANGNLTIDIYYDWDETTSQWVASYKDEITYDANNNMTHYIDYDWIKATGQWEVSYKDEITYDANNNMTQDISYDWDGTTSLWVAYDKYDYTYNGNGNLTIIIYYTWDKTTSLWVDSDRYEFEYDGSGNMTQSQHFNWSANISQWVARNKDEYSYDANGNMTQDLYYNWEATISLWIPSEKEEDTYDAFGRITQTIFYDWDKTNSLWVTYNKEDYIWDSNGNESQYIWYNWDEITSQWVASYKTEYTYNNLYSFSDLILPFLPYFSEVSSVYISQLFNHMLISDVGYSWDEGSGQWVTDGNGTYYYSAQNSNAVPDISTKELNVYPNPVSEKLSFIIPEKYSPITFELFDLQGRKVMTKEIASGENVSMASLKKGMYFYNLITNNQKLSGKLIKE